MACFTVIIITLLALKFDCAPVTSDRKEPTQPGDLILRDWIVIATCRASCFEKFVTYPPNDEKCVNADGCLECWAACQDTYFSTGYNELCVENVDEKCNEGCQASCHFYDVEKSDLVVPSLLWKFPEPAVCDASKADTMEFSWTPPRPTTGEDTYGTYLIYVLFVINDNNEEWTKLAMTSTNHIKVSGDHTQYETLKFMILVVTPLGVVTRTNPEYRREPPTTIITTTTPEVTNTKRHTRKSTEKQQLTTASFDSDQNTVTAWPSNNFSEENDFYSHSVDIRKQKSFLNEDDYRSLTLIIASCMSVAAALVSVICVSACYWCACHSKTHTQCQNCYLRDSFIDLQTHTAGVMRAENLYREGIPVPRGNLDYQHYRIPVPETAPNNLAEENFHATSGEQMPNMESPIEAVSPRYAPLMITVPTTASTEASAPDSCSSVGSYEMCLPHTINTAPEIQIDSVWTESTL